MRIPTQREIALLRTKYSAGTKVYLIHMEGEELPAGSIGTVRYTDEMGQLHVLWEQGMEICLIPGSDSFRRATSEEIGGKKNVRV